MCTQHIVEHQDIVGLPRENDLLAVVNLPDMIQHLDFNGRAIAVEGMTRQVLLVEHTSQRLLQGFIQA